MPLYHGTGKEEANNDVLNFNNHKLKIEIPNISKFNYLSKIKKLPGSLGYGYYTFEDDKEIAYSFSEKKKYPEPTVVKIQINKDFDDDHVLDFKEEYKKKLFLQFAKSTKQNEIGKIILKKFEDTHRNVRISAKQDVFAGIMTELFIKYMYKEEGKVIQIVRKDTETFLPPFDNSKYRLGIPNGTEVCIRDVNCIKTVDIISLS